MKKAKLFYNGKSQAVRLPLSFRFEGTEVYIKKMGNITLLFSTTTNVWKSFEDSLDKFSDDFLEVRKQPDQQVRDSF
ncbi:MAG: AbrB/MazE/SpoVT family DNA-binding domain-containing protein [Legionellales bacterium]|nr:MAG: AbrB/MazE/SpoVT family DNA-binding domain-containing protein [Legionellales bacterium]